MIFNKIIYYIAKCIKKIQLPAIKNSEIHKTSEICSAAHIVGCQIDRYSYIGNNCTVINCKIGAFCSIADFCIIGGAAHPTQFVSSSPVFLKGKNCMKTNFSKHIFEPSKTTYIGNDVWLGNSCLIKAGISIGDGAVIGMGSVVTKDVSPYTIVAGNPAREIRKRFNPEIIDKLCKLSWWKWDDEKLYKRATGFADIKQFLLDEEGER